MQEQLTIRKESNASAPQYKMRIEKDVDVPMRDGAIRSLPGPLASCPEAVAGQIALAKRKRIPRNFSLRKRALGL